MLELTVLAILNCNLFIFKLGHRPWSINAPDFQSRRHENKFNSTYCIMALVFLAGSSGLKFLYCIVIPRAYKQVQLYILHHGPSLSSWIIRSEVFILYCNTGGL